MDVIVENPVMVPKHNGFVRFVSDTDGPAELLRAVDFFLATPGVDLGTLTRSVDGRFYVCALFNGDHFKAQ